MSGVKHTPGPWRIDVNGSENWSVDYEGPSSTFMTICAQGRREPVGFAVEPTAWGSDEEIEANARLIAAAPDLLEALEPEFMDAVAAVLDANNCHATAGSVRNYAIKQRAALSRATGDRPEKGAAL